MGFIDAWIDRIKNEIRDNLKLGDLEDYLDRAIKEGEDLQQEVDAMQAQFNAKLDSLQDKAQAHLEKLKEWRDQLEGML